MSGMLANASLARPTLIKLGLTTIWEGPTSSGSGTSPKKAIKIECSEYLLSDTTFQNLRCKASLTQTYSLFDLELR